MFLLTLQIIFFYFPQGIHHARQCPGYSADLPKGEDAVQGHRQAGTPPTEFTTWQIPVFPKSELGSCS